MSDCSTHAFDVPLKSCPFCGGDVETLTAESMNGGYLFCIMCNDCCSRGDVYDNEAEAIAAWNTRAERTCECIVEYAKSPLDGKTIVLHRCSSCNELMRPHMNYCPNCGAKVVDE